MSWFKSRKSPPTEDPPLASNEDAPAEAIAVREFVYLDETSVLSIASSAGQPLQVNAIEVQATSNDFTAEAKAGLGLAGTNIGGMFQSVDQNTLSQQVESRYNIQATFAELHKSLRPQLRLDAGACLDQLDPAGPALSVEALIEASVLTPVRELARGDVVEINVTFQPHNAYKWLSAIAELDSFADVVPELAQISQSVGLTMGQMRSFLDRLLSGLVPFESEARDLEVITIDGIEYLAQKGAALNLRVDSRQPLFVAGITELDKYWKDTRRSVFGYPQYTLMGRSAHRGLNDSWTALKSLQSLEAMIGVNQLKQLDELFNSEPVTDAHAPIRADEICLRYINALAAEFGAKSLDRDILENGVAISASADHGPPGLLADREMLRQVADAFFESAGIAPDVDRAALVRQTLLTEIGRFGAPKSEAKRRTTELAGRRRLLEIDVIAAYW